MRTKLTVWFLLIYVQSIQNIQTIEYENYWLINDYFKPNFLIGNIVNCVIFTSLRLNHSNYAKLFKSFYGIKFLETFKLLDAIKIGIKYLIVD